jgi:hypothetical protein
MSEQMPSAEEIRWRFEKLREALASLPKHGWWDAPRTLGDAIRCLFGQHRVAYDGFASGMFVERCSCGAGRMNGHMWLRETWWCGPRKGPES